MQYLQPMHLFSRQITGPSSVLYMALVRHAAVHAGCKQCMHCFLTKISPAFVLNRLTTVHCDSVCVLSLLYIELSLKSGSGRPCAPAHETSQVRQPKHRVVSTSTPTFFAGAVTGPALLDPASNVEPPTTPRDLRKILLSISLRSRSIRCPPTQHRYFSPSEDLRS
jgi:hypothetical protein